MAPVAIILGSFGGTVSALVGWVLFGLGLAAAVQLYFIVALGVASALMVTALIRRRGDIDSGTTVKARAHGATTLQQS